MMASSLKIRPLFFFAHIILSASYSTKGIASAWLENPESLKLIASHGTADNIFRLLENPAELGEARQQFNSLFLEYGLTDDIAITMKHLDKTTESGLTVFSNSNSQIGIKFDVSFLNPGLIPLGFTDPVNRDKVASISLHKTATSFKEKNSDNRFRENANSFYLELADKFIYTDFNVIQSVGFGQDFFSGTKWSRQHGFLTIELDKFYFGVRSDFFDDSSSGYREINRNCYVSTTIFEHIGVTLLKGKTSWKGLKAEADTLEVQFQYRFE